ncbi:MAG: phage holin family protein [Candidatus Azobacteroides sp.]|nr:phage holin family protein [Candidatus Azobacteroides sp.]
MENKKEGKYIKSLNDLKEYAYMHYDLLCLNLLEKLSKIIALLLIIMVSLMLLVIMLVYFSLALAYELSEIWNSKVGAFLCVGGIYLLISAFLYFFRKNIFVNPLVKQLSKILFDDPNETI